MTLALDLRVLYERNAIMSMEMSFLLHALEQGASACPDKSGQVSNADMTMIRHGGRCPDLLGSACALLLGHETKKTSPCSFTSQFQRPNIVPLNEVFAQINRSVNPWFSRFHCPELREFPDIIVEVKAFARSYNLAILHSNVLCHIFLEQLDGA
jgi:hypothetical protein